MGDLQREAFFQAALERERKARDEQIVAEDNHDVYPGWPIVLGVLIFLVASWGGVFWLLHR